VGLCAHSIVPKSRSAMARILITLLL